MPLVYGHNLPGRARPRLACAYRLFSPPLQLAYLHFCSLNIHQGVSSNHLPTLPLLSHHAYTSCESGGPFIQVMYCHLSSMFLSHGVTRCARLFSLLSLISCMDFQSNATAGAPKGNGGFRRDEDFDPPQPSSNQNTDSQQPSAATQTNTGEHGSGRFCFCL